MIASLLLGFQTPAPTVRIVEMPEPTATRMEVQAVVKLPKNLYPKEWAALTIIRDTLTLGTTDYSKDELLNYALLVGDPIKVSLSYDHLRIGFSLPANSQEIGSDMLSNLVRKALFREDEFASALALAPFRSFPAWQSSLSTWDKDFRGLRLSEIHQVYQRFFRPENVTVVIAGAFPAGEATKAFTERFEDWRPVTVRRVYETKPQELYKSHPTPTVGLWADMTGVPYPHLELASIALGLGKHGAAFRIIRNQLGLSYRQEGVIAPGPGGLRLGVVYQSSSSEGAESALAAIAKDIETWNQATLDRARATISALDALGMSYSSVYLDPSSPIAGTNADRAYWSAYATTNSLPKDRKAVLGAMATVSLEQLKILAKRWASEAKIEITR